MPVRLLWLQMLQKNTSAVDVGLVLWHLKTLPDPLGSEWQNCANLTCSHKARISKRPSMLKSYSNLFVWCWGLDAALIAVGGFPGAAEGARTRNLGRRGVPGSPLTPGIAYGRKLQAHRGSGEQLEHVSHS